MLSYVKAENQDRQTLLEMCSTTLTGAEAFTYLSLNEDISEGRLWCAKDEKNEIISVIYDDGDYYIKAAGNVFSSFFGYREKCLMIYSGHSVPESSAVAVEGADLLRAFRLFCESDKLSFDNEQRYVYRRRAVNAGLARMFGIFSEGEPISVASVSAVNLRYAVISDVFTRRDMRGKGLAASVLAAAVGSCLEDNKIPLLLCDDTMRSYYERAGFEYYGKM